jgi:hypothetical protein
MPSPRVRRVFIPVAAFAIAVASLGLSPAAWADGSPDISSPASVLVGGSVVAAAAVPVDPDASVQAALTSSGGTTISVKNQTDSVPSFSVADAVPVGKSGDYSVVAAPDRRFAAYVKAAPNGAQVVFAAGSPEALGRFAITFSEPIVAQHVDSFGTTVATLKSGRQIAIAAPWARDAQGRSLPTSYTLAGKTIQQNVAVAPDTSYPVAADPAWSYVRNYSLGSTAPSKAKSLLHSCFNCKFPVSGAPHSFPSPGQNLPLTVGPWSFHCTFGTESSSGPDGQGNTSYSFYFNAAQGHVDGVGSHITFSMTGGRSANTLSVYGYVVNDNPAGVGRPAYLAGATVNWAIFAGNLRNG